MRTESGAITRHFPLAIALCTSAFCLSARASEVLISEVLADPPAGLAGDANGDGLRHTYQDEFVELCHTGTETVSLSNWKVGDDDTAISAYFTFPETAALAPGTCLLLFGGGMPSSFSVPTYTDDGRIGNGLSNSGDAIFLLNANGDTVDVFQATSWPADQSLARRADRSLAAHKDIDAARFSPGTAPVFLPLTEDTEGDSEPPSPDSAEAPPTVFIRQILADPPSGPTGDANGDGLRHTYQDEFVELVNTGPDTVALGGWKIGDDDVATDAYFSFPPGTTLAPGGRLVLFGGGIPQAFPFAVFTDDGRIGNGLSNGGDNIVLLDENGAIVNQVIGQNWPSDQSLVRQSATAPFVAHRSIADGPFSLEYAHPDTTPNSSDPSDLIPSSAPSDPPDSLPPPAFHSTPDSSARTGLFYRYPIATDDGALTLVQGPTWLSLDAATQELSGTPPTGSEGTWPVHLLLRRGSTYSDQRFTLRVRSRPQLYISEILADPPSGLTGDANGDGRSHPYEDEFVELFNAGDSAVNLSGWRLSDDDVSAQKQFHFPAGTILSAGQYLVLFGTAPQSDNSLLFADDGRIGNGLTNSGDRILLIDAEGDTLISLHFANAGIDQSLYCEAETCFPHTRLPGRQLYSPGESRPQYQHFSIETLGMRAGDVSAATLYGHYSGGRDSLDNRQVQWLSIDSSILTVDGLGKLRAKAAGRTRLEAWSNALFLAQSQIEIRAAPAPTNRDPHITSQPIITAYAEGPYRYLVIAEDPERATLVYALAQAPPGFKMHYASGLLSGRAPSQPGNYPIAIEVTDGRGGITNQRFSLTVRSRPQLQISEILADPPRGLRGDANGDGKRHAYEDEFVEILNTGKTSIDLSGCRLADAKKSTFAFPPQSHLPPGERAVIFGGGHPQGRYVFSAGGRIGDGLGNKRDAVFILAAEVADTLARAHYSLARAPAQSLVWVGALPSLHASTGVDLLFSPGAERPMLSRLRLADVYLSFIQGEKRQPTLLALWSDGSEHYLRETVRWTSSHRDVINVDAQGMLNALKPGRSTITAQLDTHATPTYSAQVHLSLVDHLHVKPPTGNTRSLAGAAHTLTVHSPTPNRLSYHWSVNGRRLAFMKPQITHICCENATDTIRVIVRRGREYLQRQWLFSQQIEAAKVPTRFRKQTALYIRAYPNPFNASTRFEFALPSSGHTRLTLYDIQGQTVRTLIDGDFALGRHMLPWNGRDTEQHALASGIYFYQLHQGKTTANGKLLLLR